MKWMLSLCCVALVALALSAPAARAQVPPACQQQLEDWGDAPECIPAYPSGVIGKFPTCVAACSPGTQELFCTANSMLPGPTGFIRHLTPPTAPHFWLGCWPTPAGAGGIDSEPDGKTNTPTVGVSACAPGLVTDCVETAFAGMTFDQDECWTDVNDHGLIGPDVFPACGLYPVTFQTFNCGPTIQAWLNVCVDWNQDGDWNDNVACDPDETGSQPCAYEWAIKNLAIPILPGCAVTTSPPLLAGTKEGPAWLRISLTLEPVPDDYPWNGSASSPLLAFQGGETEDYPVRIERPLPTSSGTWGKVKATYR